MNSKLLKVCAAVMLIAGAENVMCDPAASNKRFTSVSAEATVKAEVKALVLVDFEGNRQELSLIKDDGEEETDDEKLSFSFNVKKVAIGYGLRFEPIGNLKKGKNGETVLCNSNGQQLPISVVLMDGENQPVDFKLSENLPFRSNYAAGKWKLKFSTELTNDTLQGVYTGGVKISVVATD